MKSRIESCNFIRIFCMTQILLFHANNAYGVSFGTPIIDEFINVGAIGCTVFFMLSAFFLRQNYRELKVHNAKDIKAFVVKRLISLYPSYLLLLIVAFYYNLVSGVKITTLIRILPIQLSMAQTILFPRLYDYADNNNFWFISTLFILYILFPFLNEFTNALKQKQKFLLFILLILTSEYLYYLNVFLGNEYVFYYMNPLLRIPEFFCGLLLADFFHEKRISNFFKGPLNLSVYALGTIFSIAFVMPSLHLNYYIYFNLYNIIVIPFSSAFILCISNSHILNKLGQNKIIKYFASLGLLVYLCQPLSMHLIQSLVLPSKFPSSIIFIVITLISAVLIHELVEKPAIHYLRKKFVPTVPTV